MKVIAWCESIHSAAPHPLAIYSLTLKPAEGIVTLTLGGRRGTKATMSRRSRGVPGAVLLLPNIECLRPGRAVDTGCQSVPAGMKVAIPS